MRVLIAGFGSIGRRHFHNLLALGERDIVFYRTGHSVLADDELKDYPVEHNLESALGKHRPEAVIVANPTALHLEVAIPAAEAGCHLLLEKPISHSFARVDEFSQVVSQKGVRVLVGYQFRFHPTLRRLKTLLEEGIAGHPLSLRCHWGEYLPGWHPWEDYRRGYSARRDLGGGVVLTLSHPLDYLRWLFGEVSEVWGFTGNLSDLALEVEDHAEIGMRFANGMLASIHLDYCQKPPAHYLEVVCSEGVIRWDGRDGTLLVTGGATGQVHSYAPPPDFERNSMFLEQMRHFLAVARGEAQPFCTLEDGVQALRIALAVHTSQAEGRLVRL